MKSHQQSKKNAHIPRPLAAARIIPDFFNLLLDPSGEDQLDEEANQPVDEDYLVPKIMPTQSTFYDCMIETLVPEDFRNLTGNINRVEYQATLQKLGRFDLWSAYSHEINAYPCPMDKSWRDFVACQPTPEFKLAAGQCAAATVIRALAWEPDLIAQCEALHLANQVRQDAVA